MAVAITTFTAAIDITAIRAARFVSIIGRGRPNRRTKDDDAEKRSGDVLKAQPLSRRRDLAHALRAHSHSDKREDDSAIVSISVEPVCTICSVMAVPPGCSQLYRSGAGE